MFAKKSVIISAATSDAVAVAVESDAWDDDEVVVAGIRLILRLEDIEIADGKASVFC